MRIRTNTSASRAFRENRKTGKEIAKNLEKLSSGYCINRAADDAAGLGISEKMRMKLTELKRCQNNVLEGEDLARTADGALAEINDMLCRARGLCIQAANGTYSDQELAAISHEMNTIFEEIDRITAGSCHNTIHLFRGKVEPEYRDVVVEKYDKLPDGQVEPWGTMEFIKDTPFNQAEKAKAASVTFELDDSIDFNDVNSLNGKSIRVGGTTFYFTDDKNSTPYGTTISLKGQTVESALKQLRGAYNIQSVEVNKDERTVKLTSVLSDWDYELQANGILGGYTAPDGDGTIYNDMLVQAPSGAQNIGQVDGSGSSNNQPTYNDTVSFRYTLPDKVLTKSDITNLDQNSLRFWDYSGTSSGSFTPTAAPAVSLSGFTVGMKRDQVGAEIAKRITDLGTQSGITYKASYDPSSGSLTVESKKTGFNGPRYIYLHESTASGTGGGSTLVHSWSSNALQVSCTQTATPTPERPAQYQITIPKASYPYSVNVGGTVYVYYNSMDSATPTTFNGLNPNLSYNTVLRDISTGIDAKTDIIDNIKKLLENRKLNVSVNDNVITVTAKQMNTDISNKLTDIYGSNATVSFYKSNPTTGGSSKVLLSSDQYSDQEVNVPFQLGSDPTKLVGTGFRVGDYQFEFTDGSSGLSSSYRDINIAGCKTSAEVADVVHKALQAVNTRYSAAIDTVDPNKMLITVTRHADYDFLAVTDGDGGIVKGGSTKFSGGTYAGDSQIEMDFSFVNQDNLKDLLGKGFRITCATCPGEYINVFFCWENDGTIPQTFDRFDASSGANRTIHNIPVELSQITDGHKIVESIVEQVRPTLNHYTDVVVGDPPTTLIAKEKRHGDVINAGETQIRLGSVLSGMETNFTYGVTVKTERVWPPDGEVELKTDNVKIYTGSDPVPQYIDVHLPYIDLEWLRLNPPEIVDFIAEDQDPSDWLARVDKANIAISDARGTIGADYNRLEHAWQDLNQAEIQLTDAESLIRDADVAELMMEQTKLQILTESQQAMLSQANTQAQNVLQLLG